MLFAKHGYAHAHLDKHLQSKKIPETLLCLGQGIWGAWSCRKIIAPVARDEDSVSPERWLKVASMLLTSYRDLFIFLVIFTWSGYSQLHGEPTRSDIFPHIGFPISWETNFYMKSGSLERRHWAPSLHLSSIYPIIIGGHEKSPLPPDFQAVLTQLN